MPPSDAEKHLDEAALARLLRAAPGWKRDGTTLTKTFDFKDWKQAIAFVDRVAVVAEKLQHHPDVHIEGYRHVRIVTTTHSTKMLSDADLFLAYEIEAVADPHDRSDPATPRRQTRPRA